MYHSQKIIGTRYIVSRHNGKLEPDIMVQWNKAKDPLFDVKAPRITWRVGKEITWIEFYIM